MRVQQAKAATIALLFTGYAGYYVCRSNLSVAAPLLIAGFHHNGVSIDEATWRVGALASAGTFAYAVGKFGLTWTADAFGGKRVFLAGMAGAVAFTVLFASVDAFWLLLLAWIGNRLVQSVGWAGLVKVSSKWFSWSVYGGVMAILSLSFLVGDAVSRAGLGGLIAAGLGWRSLFLVAAAVLSVIFIICAVALRESSAGAGFAAPEANPDNVYARDHGDRPTAASLIVPLLRNREFLIVCGLSFGTTLLREALGTWTPTYFVEQAGLAPAVAATCSALIPAAGAISVLAAGWLSDRLGRTGRARVSFAGLSLAACALAATALLPKHAGLAAVVLLCVVALLNTGPYSFLAGAFALDFGGSVGGAMSSGIIDGVGYAGGSLAGIGIARLALSYGWAGAFWSLAALCLATAAMAALLAAVQREKDARRHLHD